LSATAITVKDAAPTSEPFISLEAAAIANSAPDIPRSPTINVSTGKLPNANIGMIRAFIAADTANNPTAEANNPVPDVNAENPATTAKIAVIVPRPIRRLEVSIVDINLIAPTNIITLPAIATNCNADADTPDDENFPIIANAPDIASMIAVNPPIPTAN